MKIRTVIIVVNQTTLRSYARAQYIANILWYDYCAWGNKIKKSRWKHIKCLKETIYNVFANITGLIHVVGKIVLTIQEYLCVASLKLIIHGDSKCHTEKLLKGKGLNRDYTLG